VESHTRRQREGEKATPLGSCIAQFCGTEARDGEITDKSIERDHSYSTALLKNGKKGSSLRRQHTFCQALNPHSHHV